MVTPPTTLNITSGSGGASAADTGDTGPGGPGTMSGGTQSTGSSMATAKDMFINNVFPELSKKPDAMTSACVTCHATGTSGAPIFMVDQSAEGSYNAITGFMGGMFIVDPANSLLLNHGEHTGPAMFPQLQGDATAWIVQEVKERGKSSSSASSSGTGGPAPITESDAIKQFGACMDYNEWLADGMDNLAKMQTGQGKCNGCHSGGDGGNWLSLNVQETFDKNTVPPYIRRMIQGTVKPDGSFDDLVPSHRWEMKGQEAQQCDPTKEACHPMYTLPPDMVTGIDTFVKSTLDAWHLGNCGMAPKDAGAD